MSINGILFKAGPLAGFALSIILTTACGGSTTSVAARISPSPSAGQDCRGVTETDPSYSAPPGVTFPSLTVDGKLRDYRLFRPPTAGPNPVALVVVLHGSPIDAQGFEDVIQFDTEAVAAGFVTAYPNGCAGYWSYAERGPYQGDEDFVRQTISDVESRYQIDKSRVYLVGASAGSWMVYRLACDMADQIAAIASISGSMRLTDPCQPSNPVSLLEMHGTQDEALPWDGGGAHLAFPVEAVVHRWASLDGCTGNVTPSHSGITNTSLWNHCSGGVSVRLDAVVGGNHQWFGSSLSPVPGEPNANVTIWNFFRSVPTRK